MECEWFGFACWRALLEERDYEERTRKLIIEQRERLSSSITRNLGWKVWPGQANFLLVRLPSSYPTSTHLQEWMAKRGILIRDCSMYPGLSERDFRIAVFDEERNQRLLEAFAEYTEAWGRG